MNGSWKQLALPTHWLDVSKRRDSQCVTPYIGLPIIGSVVDGASIRV